MTTIKLKNTQQLRNWLDANLYIYEVVQDGWAIMLSFHHLEDIFKLGVEFGEWKAFHPEFNPTE